MVRPSQGDKGYVCSGWTGGPKRARNRGVPREARRNMGVYTPYPRKDTFTPLTMTLKEILSMESVNFPELSPLIGTPKKQNLNKFCDYHGDRGHNTNDCYQLNKQIEKAVASRKLAHLVKDIRRNNQRNGNPRRNGVKDMYPLPEEGEGLAYLMGYLYKCFLRLPKEYNQIRMAEGDEEKTEFHTKEGIYYFTYMPKELKNSAATLQRKMEKVLADQRGWK
ncbi:hypothetical protein Tco_0449900 [Tanacetum coccineum]